MRKNKKKTNSKKLSLINSDAAEIDIGSEIHYVAVPEDRDPKPVRSFECFTSDLIKLSKLAKRM